ncbi:abortive phage infection protein [Oscillatoriales cyanobacterium USR001]|nr:abortive phage infection protein [Oscillatoriales cyanobacterium USR001]
MEIADKINSFRLFWLSIPAILKVIAFFLVWISLWLPIAIPSAIALNWHPPQPLGNKKLPLLASLYLIAPIIIGGEIWLDGGSWANLGLVFESQSWVSLIIGLSLGVFSIISLFGIQLLLNWINWQKREDSQIHPLLSIFQPNLILTLFLGLWISGTEELIFRGLLQNLLMEDYAVLIAAAIASLIFAGAHLLWEFRETFTQLPGLWLMGMVLTLARICDRGNLGLAIGLHTGWILVIATLDSAKIIAYTGRVPEWITGIKGQPLAGIGGIFFLVVTAGILAIGNW